MTEQNSSSEDGQRRFDPELLKKGLRCDLNQYEMLKRCSDKKDMTEWNEWRKKNPNEDILLEGAFLWQKYLVDANFTAAGLQNVEFPGAYLQGAKLLGANLKNGYLEGTSLQGADFSRAIVDGGTLIWKCKVDRRTKFEGVGLDAARIYPELKQLLEYNIRRMNWEQWYKYEDWDNVCPKKERSKVSQVLRLPVCWFWQISDYGRSTKQIIYTFFQLAIIFAGIYYAWGLIDYDFLGIKDHPGIISDLFVLEDKQQSVSRWLVPFRAVYFSIVTMTTLGFGDMYANAHSFLRGLFGHVLLALQVILGYVLLGALVTRFAVLFTAGGPAGKFANEKEKKAEKKSK